jgi:hypothetical protein
MKRLALSVSGIAIAAGIMIVMGSSEKDDRVKLINSKDAKGYVIMELFTSQGCSSCPPADEILGKYAMKNDEHIIPLAFHIDYWDRLGWTDSFSNSKYTRRQQDYAAKLGLESVYTPQLILNGQKELVGSEAGAIATVVNDLLKEQPAVSINISDKVIAGNRITIRYSLDNRVSNSSINAALVERAVSTHIKAGENRGVKLNNYNVVRDFTTTQLPVTAGTITLGLPMGGIAAEFSIVLFVQDNASGKITGAVKAGL